MVEMKGKLHVRWGCLTTTQRLLLVTCTDLHCGNRQTNFSHKQAQEFTPFSQKVNVSPL